MKKRDGKRGGDGENAIHASITRCQLRQTGIASRAHTRDPCGFSPPLVLCTTDIIQHYISVLLYIYDITAKDRKKWIVYKKKKNKKKKRVGTNICVRNINAVTVYNTRMAYQIVCI